MAAAAAAAGIARVAAAALAKLQANSETILRLTVPTATANRPTLDQGSGGRGKLTFYIHNDWNSANASFDLADYLPGSRQPVGAPILNAATNVAFNFPVGVVCTIMQYQISGIARRAGTSDPSLKSCGATLDLVGTGKTEYVSLTEHAMNDVLSCFFYRFVDLSLGCVEFYQHAPFKGNRVIIFLSEWAPNQDISFAGWFIGDRISSVRWGTLPDQTMGTFLTKGPFLTRSDLAWGGSRINSVMDLAAWSNMQDKITGFCWTGVLPVMEIIESFKILIPSTTPSTHSVEMQGTNSTAMEQKTSLTLDRESTTSLELTLETTESSSFETSVSVEAGPAEVSFTFRRDLSKRKERTTTETLRVNTSVSQEITIPPMSSWKASLTAQVAKLPPCIWTSTAKRWYDLPVPNSAPDPTRPGLYLREETVNGTVTGGIVGKVTQLVEATPIKAA